MAAEHEEVKKTNAILYPSIDDFTEVTRHIYSPSFVDNINAFCKLNGFNILIELLQEPGRCTDLTFAKKALDICISVKGFMKPEYKFQFFTGVIDQILTNFKTFSNETLKSISQEEMEKFINCLEFILEQIYTDKKQADEVIQNLELDLALRFLHTPYIEKRVCGLNILISKVNLINRSNFSCTWKRKVFSNRQDVWLTAEVYLKWLLDNDIFGLFFGETLHSELVVKYSAVLSFLYSKDQLNEKHFELMWDCAINKHDAYRVNILKVLSTLALQVKPSHAKYLFDKIKSMELSEYCKFILQLLKHLNKNSCRGPLSEQAAHEAAFGKENKEYGYSGLDGLLDIKRIGNSDNKGKKTRSFSLGGDEKETNKVVKKRHNSPMASRRAREFDPVINISPLDTIKKTDLLDSLLDKKVPPKNFDSPKQSKKMNEETKDEETKDEPTPKVADDRASTDEEDLLKSGTKAENNSE